MKVPALLPVLLLAACAPQQPISPAQMQADVNATCAVYGPPGYSTAEKACRYHAARLISGSRDTQDQLAYTKLEAARYCTAIGVTYRQGAAFGKCVEDRTDQVVRANLVAAAAAVASSSGPAPATILTTPSGPPQPVQSILTPAPPQCVAVGTGVVTTATCY